MGRCANLWESMQFSFVPRFAGRVIVFSTAALSLFAQMEPPGHPPIEPPKEVRIKEVAQGLPPRSTPLEYPSRTKVGSVVIGADFVGHAVPTSEGTLNNEDFVTVELGVYGPKEAKLLLSLDDFSLRINGKKTPLRSVPYGMVLPGIKDPDYEPPDAIAAKKAKSGGTSIGGSGQGQSNDPPPVIHIPMEKQRAMALQTQRASLPLGDRALPQAGLLFFPYRSKISNIESIELIYNGPAGKVTMDLRP